MSTKTDAVTGAAIKRAIEGRDGRMLASFYADDAVLRVIDRNNPPSKPREVKGKSAIGTFWDDICSRAMTIRWIPASPRATGWPSRKPAPIRMGPRCSAWR
jgi:ketosteroid isomerase-like protein